jgi:hypothetical protein
MALDDSCLLHEPVLTVSTTPTCASFDSSYGDLYVIYGEGTVVHKLDSSGEPLAEFSLSARAEQPIVFIIEALAVNPSGRLGVSVFEGLQEPSSPFLPVSKPFGSLLDGATGHLITEFVIPGERQFRGLGFSANDMLYGALQNEVLSYIPVHVAELLARPESCLPGAESETKATFDCALNGAVNPEEVENTEVWFQWGKTSTFGQETPVQIACTTPCPGTPVPVTPVVINGVRPNETVDYRLAAHDQNVKPPELLTSDTTSFHTPIVTPRVLGEPNAPFVTSSSAELFAELNPENTSTEYFFEYATNLDGYCEGTLKTGTLKSAVYGRIGATLEASGLQPATTYRFRLCAIDEAGNAVDEHGGNQIAQGAFTTASVPVPQAVTGGAALGATSATISGTVNPAGQPATYTFELGVYNGTDTRYGTVFSESVGASTVPVGETVGLTGLQPGTTYAYRIGIKSGYGESTGAPMTFTTAGLPSVLIVPVPLTMLPIPPISFPVQAKVVTSKVLPNAEKLAKALKACHRRSKGKRASCEKTARKRYGAKSKGKAATK